MLMSVLEFAATADLTVQPIQIERNYESQHRFLSQGNDVVGKDEDSTCDVGSHAGCRR